MQYFDFHSHIVLKQSFQDQPEISQRIYPGDAGTLVRTCTDLPYIIQTQIQTDELVTLKGALIIGCALYGIESFLAGAVSRLAELLRPQSRYKLSVDLLQKIASQNYPLFSEFTCRRVLDLYSQDPQIHLLKKSDLDNEWPNNKILVFFTVEGCHSLIDTQFGDQPAVYRPAEILANLDILLKKDLFIFSVNLTHMQQSNICNHAFGMQLANPTAFYPRGNGLTADGRLVTQGLFHRQIHVDIKHMSYLSRKQLMNEIDQGSFDHPMSLVCTHTGFTGVPFSGWAAYIQKKKTAEPEVLYLEIAKSIHASKGASNPGVPAFNMSTINLFDEEIVWIVKHGGMIGLSMDRRILGYLGPFDEDPTGLDIQSDFLVDKEFFSKTEWIHLAIDESRLGSSVNDDECVKLTDVRDTLNTSLPQRNIYFYSHILLHIKHYLQVCLDAGISLDEAQLHLAIGSDFDGLINPFINIETCQGMPGLKSYILGNLCSFLLQYTDSGRWADTLNISALTENLFFQNGLRFLKSK